MDNAQVKLLLASVGNALEDGGIAVRTKEVENGHVDGIVVVSCETDPTDLGAIFATMRDRYGNFLGQEHASFRSLPGAGWGDIVDDASTRLVGKLLSWNSMAQQNQNVSGEQIIAGLENLR